MPSSRKQKLEMMQKIRILREPKGFMALFCTKVAFEHSVFQAFIFGLFCLRERAIRMLIDRPMTKKLPMFHHATRFVPIKFTVHFP